MLNLILLGLSGLQLALLGILSWGVYEYFRLKHQWMNIKRRIVTMDINEVIDELLEADKAGPETMTRGVGVGGEAAGDGTSATTSPQSSQHRERLAALVAGGRARQYLGKPLSIDQIDHMEAAEVEKLYSRYEARLGAAMTRTLGATLLQLYTSTVSMFLPIPSEEQPELLTELESDPFVEHAVSNATCELYHRFGMYLAPATAALTTLRHCRFGQQDVPRIVDDSSASKATDGNSANTRVDGGGGEGDSACTSSSCGFAND